MTALDRQLSNVQARYPEARFETTTDGQRLLVVPDVSVPAGWNVEGVTISVLVPSGFPQVNPDCFYVDAPLLLATGADPANSSVQTVFGGNYRWFSWHVSGWDPSTGTLDRYLRFCEARLKQAR